MTEKIKKNSNYLRGTIAEDLKNQVTGSVTSDSHQLIKFHGIYEQDDRDRRNIRAKKKLEKDYSFMIRLRIPGGRISAQQWIGINQTADDYSTGAIKITTRQTVQLHGVIKSQMRPTIQAFDKINLDSIAACGDVNRNVIASVFGENTDDLHKLAVNISEEFLPKTNAYKEIWLDGEKIEQESEPLYGDTYLPRKFKIAIANPPFNDVDVYAHDIGLIKVQGGYNVLVGGGMGMTHGNADTYPRVGSAIGYIDEGKILDVIKNIILIQRDFGNRENRKQARLKYTIDRLSLEWFVAELHKRLGYELEQSKVFQFTQRADNFGYDNNERSFTLFVENGRVLGNVKEALKEIAEQGVGIFTFTNNQNVIIDEITDKVKLQTILDKYNLHNNYSNITKAAMACVAFNTCPLALAEAQRYLPSLLTKIEELLRKHKIAEETISIRMTGCPNGCARPYLAEIAFVGKALGVYNMYLGADALGQRLNKLYKESLKEEEILSELDIMFDSFVGNRNANEGFGDYIVRKKII